MEYKLYIVLLVYFLAGAAITALINKRKSAKERNHNWLKYGVYFIILNVIFFSIHINHLFSYIAWLIILAGCYEILNLIIKTGKIKTGGIPLLLFLFGFYGFYRFSLSDKPDLYFVFFIVTVFDAFSQLTGQVTGKRKLIPSISPGKTVEGLLGGFLFSGLTALLITKINGSNLLNNLLLAFGIAAAAFLGDMFASYVKRRFGVKDYSKLIPGHGGFLDRFDSFIFSGLFYYILKMSGNP